jgi:hypothetical protein
MMWLRFNRGAIRTAPGRLLARLRAREGRAGASAG